MARPTSPCATIDPRRFGPYATKDWQVIKAKEDYCLRHEIPFPHFNRLAGRPVKPSPLYERLKAKGAVFEEVYGHERPRWFARHGLAAARPLRLPPHAGARHGGREVQGRASARRDHGHLRLHQGGGVEGPDAEALLDRLTANRLPQKVGGIALTHMLNRRGRIELETTIVRLARDRFYLVCAAFFEQRLLDHLAFNRAARMRHHQPLLGWAALALQRDRRRATSWAPVPMPRWTMRLPLAVGAGDRDRRAQGVGASHVLCGRTGLGAARAARAPAGRL
jgi:dimethylglycine dehydrogenase